MSIKSGIIIPDTHFPVHDKRAYELVMTACEDFKPSFMLNIGDLGNYAGISHWNKENHEDRRENPLERDLRGVYEHHEHQRRIVGDKGEIYSLDGNHEDWVKKFLRKEPQFNGFINLDRDAGYEKFHVKRIPTEKQPFKLGKLNFIHGWFTNKYHANKTGERIHHNVIYGHTHDVQEVTPANIDQKHRFTCQSIGHLSDEKVMREQYLRHRPTNWMLAFGVLNMDETGLFTFNIIKLPTYKFIFNGKVYK